MSKLEELLNECDIIRDSWERRHMKPHPDTLSEARAELAALRERIAKLEAALAKADELAFEASIIGGRAMPANPPDQKDIESLCVTLIAYRAAREAAK